jgi:hypothetical protein
VGTEGLGQSNGSLRQAESALIRNYVTFRRRLSRQPERETTWSSGSVAIRESPPRLGRETASIRMIDLRWSQGGTQRRFSRPNNNAIGWTTLIASQSSQISSRDDVVAEKVSLSNSRFWMGRRANSHLRVKWILLTDESGITHRHELDETGRLVRQLSPAPSPLLIPRLPYARAAGPSVAPLQPVGNLPIPPRIRQKLTSPGSELSIQLWNDFLTNPGPRMVSDGQQ